MASAFRRAGASFEHIRPDEMGTDHKQHVPGADCVHRLPGSEGTAEAPFKFRQCRADNVGAGDGYYRL